MMGQSVLLDLEDGDGTKNDDMMMMMTMMMVMVVRGRGVCVRLHGNLDGWLASQPLHTVPRSSSSSPSSSSPSPSPSSSSSSSWSFHCSSCLALAGILLRPDYNRWDGPPRRREDQEWPQFSGTNTNLTYYQIQSCVQKKSRRIQNLLKLRLSSNIFERAMPTALTLIKSNYLEVYWLSQK